MCSGSFGGGKLIFFGLEVLNLGVFFFYFGKLFMVEFRIGEFLKFFGFGFGLIMYVGYGLGVWILNGLGMVFGNLDFWNRVFG